MRRNCCYRCCCFTLQVNVENKWLNKKEIIDCNRSCPFACMQVKSFVSSADDLMKWFEDFRRKLQWCTPLGALPDSAHSQLKKLMVIAADILLSNLHASLINSNSYVYLLK